MYAVPNQIAWNVPSCSLRVSAIRTRMIGGPVGTSSDIASKNGFFTSLVNAREPKKFCIPPLPLH
jgi:hypothetical protein